MPRPRSAMRNVRQVLRLVLGEGLSRRQAATSLGMGATTVRDCVDRALAAGLTWPLPDEMDDADLERRLYHPPPGTVSARRPQPDWVEVKKELRRKGVTLQLLWIEYKERLPEGYQYSQFVRLYREWVGRLTVVMRQDHRAGEKLFVDYAGHTLPITDPTTGMVTQAEIFIAVLGASNFTYAEAQVSQELPQWISGHVHAFEAMGGVTQILVPDNLRSGVTKAHRYEPDLNPTYQEMAAHYGCAIIPARSYKPRDKAKAEAGVLLAERWILAKLRNHTFFSVAEANIAIAELLDALNEHPFQKLPGSRRSTFEQVDQPALKPLPVRPYEFANWKKVTVNIDYHVEVDHYHHYYSVPYQLARQKCEARISATTVEVFHRGRRVASHKRSFVRGGHTTLAEHMPEAHRRHLEWTPGRIVRWAAQTGPKTAALVDAVMRTRPHPEQGFRSCLGIIRLGQRYGPERLEAACTRALAIRAYSSRSVESILKNGLDGQPLLASGNTTEPRRWHTNVRGVSYYQ